MSWQKLQADLSDTGYVASDDLAMALFLAVTLGKPLDPSGTALTYGSGLYEDLMQGMADTITACLSQG